MVLLLPYKGAATKGLKITSNVTPMLRHILGWEEAQRFYTRARYVKDGVNKQSTFDAFD